MTRRSVTSQVTVSRATAVLAVVAVLLGLTTGYPQDSSRLQIIVAGVSIVCIALGESARIVLDQRASAPISTAAAMAMAMSDWSMPHERPAAAGATVVLAAVGMVLGTLVRRVRGGPIAAPEVAARLLGVALTAYLYRSVTWGTGSTLLSWQTDPSHPRWLVALAMVAVSALGVGFEVVLRGAARAELLHSHLRPVVASELAQPGGLIVAVIATGPLVALAEPAIKVMSIPLFLIPLVLAQFAVRRYAAVRETYRETIGSLSRLTEVAGCTPVGHGSRVAEIAVQVGRQLGMSERDLVDLEYAALLHDLGQVALREPIPGGATLLAAPVDQQRIADRGALIVRQAGVLDSVADILQRQTTPYRQVRELGEPLPLASRIIKVANAFDDLTHGDDDPAVRAAAMERIHLGLGYEYDPDVVDAMTPVLRRL